jgi:hypothetical protein
MFKVGKLLFAILVAAVAMFAPVPKATACDPTFCNLAWETCRQECGCGSVDYVDCDAANCDFFCGCGPC